VPTPRIPAEPTQSVVWRRRPLATIVVLAKAASVGTGYDPRVVEGLNMTPAAHGHWWAPRSRLDHLRTALRAVCYRTSVSGCTDCYGHPDCWVAAKPARVMSDEADVARALADLPSVADPPTTADPKPEEEEEEERLSATDALIGYAPSHFEVFRSPDRRPYGVRKNAPGDGPVDGINFVPTEDSLS
jgi:hypothetical protein